MKALAWVAPLALLFTPAGLAAQDNGRQEDAATGEIFGSPSDLFDGLAQAMAPEPLTPEQQERLPAALALIDLIMPPGTMGQLMGPLLQGASNPLALATADQPVQILAQKLGMASQDLSDLSESQVEAALSVLDPAWRERARREAEAAPAMAARMMSVVEPALRQVMAELYAIYFTDQELSAIGRFFATPEGATYARQSIRIGTDPRLVTAMMQQLPAMMEAAASIETEMAGLTSDLPPARRLADLSRNERKALARLLGITAEDLDFIIGSGE